ncbi:MAG: 4-hydroxy-tetrahydrodipicolinate synthase [Candidatus Tectomicrobia bacterium]|nr:4-hydroxy-tetrahydrodipicolinate synthase [Candidatus Tectomicrobia bacterium]
MLHGSIVALVTPFEDGSVDEAALRGLIEWHIGSGTHGIVSCGTTGESATLSHEEHDRVVEFTLEVVGGRVPVIAGAGSNSTREAIRRTRHAKEAGADAALLVVPYYNKPTQEGLYRHFRAVAEAVDIPILLYNVPGRTVANLLPETVARLAEIPNIIGIKEATGSLQQVSDVVGLCPRDFCVLSGDDFVVLPMYSVGGRGVISVSANVAPKDMAELCNAAEEGDWVRARELHYKLRPLNAAMFFETNPIPAKTALGLMGRISEDFRLPLCPMSEANRERLIRVMKAYGLLN